MDLLYATDITSSFSISQGIKNAPQDKFHIKSSFLHIIIKAGKIKEYERVVSHEMNGKKNDIVGILDYQFPKRM